LVQPLLPTVLVLQSPWPPLALLFCLTVSMSVAFESVPSAPTSKR
jgi:hypothetical protein